jgi:hypothetical protein
LSPDTPAREEKKAGPPPLGWMSIVLGGLAVAVTLIVPDYIFAAALLAVVAVVLGVVALAGRLSHASAWVGIAVAVALIVALGFVIAAMLEYTASTS